jgi:hypothetical protein
MIIENKEYYWAECCIAEDNWVECKITGIKIFDLGYGANEKGELLYNGNVIKFPKWFEISNN